MWAAGHPGDSGGLRFRPVHEGFDPGCTIYQFCGGYDIFHPTVLHLREETQSGYFCVGHAAEEEDQRRSVLPLLTCGGRMMGRTSVKQQLAKSSKQCFKFQQLYLTLTTVGTALFFSSH